jgi:hypothetical protein
MSMKTSIYGLPLCLSVKNRRPYVISQVKYRKINRFVFIIYIYLHHKIHVLLIITIHYSDLYTSIFK